jgi:RNA polymerase sigma factor (TIGR02999 family)
MEGPARVEDPATKIIRDLRNVAPQERKRLIGELVTILAGELRERASFLMGRERPNHILQTTALFHETYLRLVASKLSFEDRQHFISVSSRMMRSIVIDMARRTNAKKRGEGAVMTALDYESADRAIALDPASLLDLDRAISELEADDQKLIELKFFYGFTLEESAEAMGLNYETFRKRWVSVRRELYHALSRG